VIARLLAMLALALVAEGVSAHALVVSSQPAAGAVVPAGSLHVALGFNSRIDAKRSRVVLRSPDGTEREVAVAGDAQGRLAGNADVERTGHWSLHWQVLSVDGHVTRGEIPFTVGEARRIDR
jgi:methionine-rich copper-binding protein CopC